MDSSPNFPATVRLTDGLAERCKARGHAIVQAYREGRHAASLAVSSHGAELNVDLQINAKMAECAFCLMVGLDPLVALWWSDRPDPGYDCAWRGWRWDVKSTKLSGRYLIWPVNKRHIFESKPFDMLALMKQHNDNLRFSAGGWVTKTVFADRHEVADEAHRLTTGTWYMDECCLGDLDMTPTKENSTWANG